MPRSRDSGDSDGDGDGDGTATVLHETEPETVKTADSDGDGVDDRGWQEGAEGAVGGRCWGDGDGEIKGEHMSISTPRITHHASRYVPCRSTP